MVVISKASLSVFWADKGGVVDLVSFEVPVLPVACRNPRPVPPSMSEIVDEALAFYRRFHPGLLELVGKGLAAFARDCQQRIIASSPGAF